MRRHLKIRPPWEQLKNICVPTTPAHLVSNKSLRSAPVAADIDSSIALVHRTNCSHYPLQCCFYLCQPTNSEPPTQRRPSKRKIHRHQRCKTVLWHASGPGRRRRRQRHGACWPYNRTTKSVWKIYVAVDVRWKMRCESREGFSRTKGADQSTAKRR